MINFMRNFKIVVLISPHVKVLHYLKGPIVYCRNIYQSQAVATWDPHKIGPIAGGSKFDTTCSIG